MHSEFFESLKGQTLDDEMIKRIQAESGKDVTEAKTKMQTQIDSLTGQLTDLQNQVTQRDTDLGDLRDQLEKAGQSSTKLGEVQKSFDALTQKYNDETAHYKEQLERQKYEFLAKETVNGVEFSSNAAKENFYNKLIAKNLPIENEKLLGFDDYLTVVKQEDPGAFVAEQQTKTPPPASFSNPEKNDGDGNKNEPVFGFNFIGVRKHE